MQIGYVSTNYNNTSYTTGAIESLVQDDGHQYEIVVVDNNLESQSARELSALSEKYPNVDALFMPSNVGYFRESKCRNSSPSDKTPRYRNPRNRQ